MKHSAKFVGLSILLLACCPATSSPAEDTLDTMLPNPFWLRSRLDDLDVDAETRKQIVDTYYESEPEYHRLKKAFGEESAKVQAAIAGDEFDQMAILAQMSAALKAEAELKLYQTKVRVTLLSKLSDEQRRRAQALAKEKPRPIIKNILREKVERIREMGGHLAEAGKPAEDLPERLQEIETAIKSGKTLEAGKMLGRLTVELEAALERE